MSTKIVKVRPWRPRDWQTAPARDDDHVARVVAIEYYRSSSCWRMHQVWVWVTMKGERGGYLEMYDASYCRRDDMTYLDLAGGGGDIYVNRYCKPRTLPARLWLEPGQKIVSAERMGERPCLTDAQLARMGIRRLRRPIMLRRGYYGDRKGKPIYGPFEDQTPCGEGGTIYCPKCDDSLPDEDSAPCEHLHWCDTCSAHVYVDSHVSPEEEDGELPEEFHCLQCGAVLSAGEYAREGEYEKTRGFCEEHS